MKKRRLGAQGPEVSVVGLGCMAMSGTYGPVEDAESIATIHEAMERGVTLLDTGDFYGRGHNELLLREALKGGKRDRVFLQVKFGAQLEPSGRFIGFDGRPASVKTFLTYTLTRLGTDHVDLYQPSRLDPVVPIEETVGAVADMVKAGYVRFIGSLGDGSGNHQARARRSPHHRAADRVLADEQEHREGDPAHRAGAGDWRDGLRHPFARTPGAHGIAGIGKERYPRPVSAVPGGKPGAKPPPRPGPRGACEKEGDHDGAAGLRMGPVSRHGDRPPPGGKKQAAAARLLGALDLSLTPVDLEEIERAVPAAEVAGGRYDEAGMSSLDSERLKA